ncbi:MAG TPA: iron-containing alcohol dehydrogenase [Dongiaceae bacterium]|nr:iron-containing alcohol dehydrogenase [Dongiaceae bacterium]
MPHVKFTMSPNPAIACGVDRIEKIAGDVAALAAEGAPVLLVADPGLGNLADRVAGLLKAGGSKVALFTDIRSDPLATQIDAAAELTRSSGAKVVVALGGGSSLDSAKLAAACAVAEQPASHYQLAQNPLPEKPLPVICLPTTAGTGSEATRVSVYTLGSGEKVWAWGDPLRPALSILDPRLTVSLPPHLTAATGVDALVHAIEATTIRRANIMNDGVCLQAIRLVAQHLPRAVAQGDDLEARQAMQIAACLAGQAIDNSGTGIAHAIGHALGAIGHVHHGRAVGLCLRAAIGWNAEAGIERHAQVAQAMGVPCEGRATKDVAKDLAPAFDKFLRDVRLKIALADDGLSAADAERLATTTMAPENKAMRDSNIREITLENARHFANVILTAA